MKSDRPLMSGAVLGDRYVLQDQVSESLGVRNWRAVDTQLERNVRVELLPADDPRAEQFVAAARDSVIVRDPRFLPVIDILENEQAFHAIVREWARAVPLHALLAQSPLTNRRAAEIVSEVAEAIAHAHERGVYHRRLTPHQILLKQNGGVRIIGLGVATALAPPNHEDSDADLARYSGLDVQAIGKLLYACLVGRWPGGHVDGLRAAPTQHGLLMRPHRVRAGIAPELDDLTQRILMPERQADRMISTASEIADATHDYLDGLGFAGLAPGTVSDNQMTDLGRFDPVVVPSGPPPGLEPPRRRPKALEATPPTRAQAGAEAFKQAFSGHRAALSIGIALVLALLFVLIGLVAHQSMQPDTPVIDAAPVQTLQIASADVFDPLGDSSNHSGVSAVIDQNLETGWQTATYSGSRRFGGVKDGMGILLDLGSAHEVHQVRVFLAGKPTDLSLKVAPATFSGKPSKLADFRDVARANEASEDATFGLGADTFTRWVLVWVRGLPPVGDNQFRAEVLEVSIRGR